MKSINHDKMFYSFFTYFRILKNFLRLAPLATIADTALEAKNQNSESDIYNEFLVIFSFFIRNKG
jgi:hypothetical protein